MGLFRSLEKQGLLHKRCDLNLSLCLGCTILTAFINRNRTWKSRPAVATFHHYLSNGVYNLQTHIYILNEFALFSFSSSNFSIRFKTNLLLNNTWKMKPLFQCNKSGSLEHSPISPERNQDLSPNCWEFKNKIIVQFWRTDAISY